VTAAAPTSGAGAAGAAAPAAGALVTITVLSSAEAAARTVVRLSRREQGREDIFVTTDESFCCMEQQKNAMV
jgi:hypothetical protein